MRRAIAAALAIISLAACATDGGGARAGSSGPDSRVELTLFGAASLRDVLARIETAYEASTPGVDLATATDSSAALRAQIEQGAPADVFLAADTDNPEALVEAGLAKEVRPFASNSLAVIVPLDNPRSLRSPADLAGEGVRVIAAGERVPITRYAEAFLDNVAALDGAPDEFRRGYERNVASREDNVKAIVAKIELGEGDAAIVYATDALASDKVLEIPVPAEANVRATYAAAALSSGEAAEAARFLDWLVGPEGQAILAEFGFLPPP